MADAARFSFPKLSNNNYVTWKFRMEMLLTRDELWHVIADVKPEPVSAQWTRDDRKAKATIGLAIEDSQLGLLKDVESARAVWDALKNHHEKATVTSRVSLLKKCCSKNLQENGDMECHLMELDELFDRLQAAGLDLGQEMKVAMVLRSLPDDYSALVTALESRPDADITMELVKGKLRDEHQKRVDSGSVSCGDKALRSESQLPEKVCFFCKQPGHWKRNCRALKNLRRSEASNSKSPSSVRGGKQKEASARQAQDDFVFYANANSSDEEVYKCFSASNVPQSSRWFVDSGATQHMTCNRAFFTELVENVHVDVTLANGKKTASAGMGSGVIQCVGARGKKRDITLQSVLYVPELDGSLLSVSVLVSRKYSVVFDSQGCRVLSTDGEAIAIAEHRGGMYVLKTTESSMVSNVSRHSEFCQHTWHRRFGHRDYDVVKEIPRRELGTHMKIVDCGIRLACECCIEGKLHRKSFPKVAERRSTAILDLVHTDVCGPFKHVTSGGKKYFMTMIDDYSRFVIVYLLANKSDVFAKMKEFVQWSETQFGKVPRVIRSDNGGEYVNKDLEKFFSAKGIKAEYTSPYSPQQNGVAERRNRYLQEMAHCMLLDAKLSKEYWGEAVMTAAFLQNRLPSRSVPCTPYELWFKRKPAMRDLKIFGCEAYVFVPSEKRGKLENRAKKMIFIGYCTRSKAYRFLDTTTKRVKISRDARFLELGAEVMPEQEAEMEPKESEKVPKEKVIEEGKKKWSVAIGQGLPDKELEEECEVHQEQSEEEYESFYSEAPDDSDPIGADNSDSEIPVRRSERSTKGILPSRLGDYVVGECENGFAAYCAGEPTTYKQAMSCAEKEEWQNAMQEEYDSLEENCTWTLVKLPPGREAIGCRWVYKKKEDSNGQVITHNARYCATEDVIADIMTKPLGATKVRKFSSMLGLTKSSS